MTSFDISPVRMVMKKSLPPYQPKWVGRGFLFKYMVGRRGGLKKWICRKRLW